MDTACHSSVDERAVNKKYVMLQDVQPTTSLSYIPLKLVVIHFLPPIQVEQYSSDDVPFLGRL